MSTVLKGQKVVESEGRYSHPPDDPAQIRPKITESTAADLYDLALSSIKSVAQAISNGKGRANPTLSKKWLKSNKSLNSINHWLKSRCQGGLLEKKYKQLGIKSPWLLLPL